MFPNLSGLISTLRSVAIGLAGAAVAMANGTPADQQVTFTKDIAPILQARCQECHQPNSIAPMSLITYEETRPWAKSIRERVLTRQMPPWHIDNSVGIQKFKNDMSLSDAQVNTIVRWVDEGAPQGDPKALPPPKPLVTDNSWKAERDGYGAPDLVVRSPEYTMPAKHQDVWFRPMSDIPLDAPRWVKMVEIRPTNLQGRRIIHHSIAYLVLNNDPDALPSGIATDATWQLSRVRPELMEWAIGKGYDLYRPGTGKLLVPGEKISWDQHIHAVGEQITAGSEIGIWFYPKGQEPKKRSYLIGFTATDAAKGLDIPPNTVAMTEGFTVLKQNALLENFQPHFHLRGKAMQLEAMGTVIHVTAWHDNTRANKFNPDPDQWVGDGDRTVDEMAFAWVNVQFLDDAEYASLAAQRKANIGNPTWEH